MITKKTIPDLTISEIERMFTKVIKNNNGCWIWQSAKSPSNHARITIRRKQYYAHRISYKLVKNLLDDSKELDHLCREPSCVNPSHLEEVSHKVNSIRGKAGEYNLVKKHCPKGHLYKNINLRTYKMKNGTTARICRSCMLVHGANYRLKKGGIILD